MKLLAPVPPPPFDRPRRPLRVVATCLALLACGEGVSNASGSPTDTVTVEPPPAPRSTITVNVNTSERHPISRFVYGMNLTTDNGGAYGGGSPWYGAIPPAGVTLDRMGGNRLSAYNWENNYSNAGSDYNFQSDDFLGTSRTPGDAVRVRVAAARARGAAAMVTVPMLGYVAADGSGPVDTRDATRSDRLATRFKTSLPTKGSAFTLTPDTRDASVYQDEFVHWVDNTFPGAVGDVKSPIFFSLDNEPDSWHATHKEVMSDSADNVSRPRLQTYDEFIARTVSYASAIKSVTPSALVFGPAVATYAGALTMGRYPHPDPRYGSQSFFDVYLSKMKDAEEKAGRRLLDALDIHWYPAAGTNAGEISNDYAPQDAAMVKARLQAPRSLWDPAYDEGSWVSGTTGGPIELLPRLRRDIAEHYPGTRIAITEYYYGRGGDISGGIAQADVLGIFGREGVFAAALWPQAGVSAAPYNGSGAKAYAFVFGAFRMFLDFDGKGGRFGDTGVAATSSDAESSSVYASLDEQGRVVMVVINKSDRPQVAAIAVSHPVPLRTVDAYRMNASAANPVRLPGIAMQTNHSLALTLDPMSVTTLVLSPD